MRLQRDMALGLLAAACVGLALLLPGTLGPSVLVEIAVVTALGAVAVANARRERS